MSKELKESMRTMSHQREIVNKEVGIIKKEPNRNSGVEKYENRTKNTLEEFSSELAKERSCELGDWTIEITHSEKGVDR